MTVPVVAALAAVTQLLATIQQAIGAGKSEITAEQMDGLFASIEASDATLSDAIARARAREAASE